MTLIEQLRRDEGVRHVAYYDTRGIITVGVGHNLHTPLSDAAVDRILSDDIASAEAHVSRLPEYALADPVRQAALINLTFWVGFGGLLKFEKMLAALRVRDWENAAKELYASDLPSVDEPRAKRLSEQIRTGEWQ
jgi:lysozyme